MGLAIKKVESIGWLALVFLVAILLYPLSLNVATMRSDLARTDAAILSAEREISYLETELRARASLAQLEEWNALYYGYEAPAARQFLEGETALAELGGDVARAVPPVLVSVSAEGVVPAGTIGSTVPTAADAAEARQLRADAGAASPRAAPAVSIDPAPAQAARSRTEQIAALETKLLSPAMLAQIEARAAEETKRR